MALNFLNDGYFAGKVGIGIVSPTVPLDVSGIIKTTTSFVGNAVVINQVTAATAGGRIIFKNNSGSDKMAMEDNGNFGIGTISPSQTLEVHSTIKIGESGVTGGRLISADSMIFQIDSDNTSGSSSYRFRTNGTADDGTELMRIQENGLVGIGTNSPNQLLELKKVSGTVAVRLHADHESTPRTGIELMRGLSDTWGGDAYTDWKIGSGSSSDADFAITSKDTTSGENERVTIEYNTGNVGIGTTSPAATLQVNGGTTFGASSPPASTSNFINNFNNNLAVLIKKISTGTGDYFSIQDSSSSSKFIVKSSGNVGIGTNNPVEKLQINSGDVLINNSSISTLKSGGSLYLDLNTFGSLGGRNFRVQNNGNVHLNIDSTGNVGIGTTAPTQKLHISGNMRLTGAFRDRVNSQGSANYVLTSTGSNGTQWVDASGSSIIGGPYLPLAGGTLTGALTGTTATFTGSIDTTAVNIKVGSAIHGTITSSSNSLTLNARNTGIMLFQSGGAEKMRIAANGRVGIGTTNPGAKLDIHTPTNSNGLLIREDTDDSITHNLYIDTADNGVGVLYANGQSAKIQLNTAGDSYFIGGNVGIGTTTPTTNLEIFDTATSVLTMSHDGGGGSGSRIDFNLINVGVSQPITAQIKATDDGAFRSDIIFTTKELATGASGVVERMRIDAGGNVGIGTTSTTGARLTVTNGGTDPQILVKNSAGNNAQILFEDNSGGSQNASVTFDQGSQNTLTIATGYNSPTNLNRINIAPAGNVALTAMSGSGGAAQTKVGIGTTTPVAKFEVTDGSSSITLGEYQNGATIFLDGVNGDFVGADYYHIIANGSSYLGLGGYGGGSTPLNINSSGTVLINATAPTQTYGTGSPIKLSVQDGMSEFETTLTNNNDWENSPVSILERASIGSGSADNKYAPNLNFHWRARVSNSLWLGANGNLNYGSYTSAGVPAVDGTFAAGNFIAALNITANTGSFTGQVTGPTPTTTTSFANKAYVDAHGGGTGPFLPLTAGSTKKLTGDLYISKSTPAIYFDNLAGGGLDPILTASGSNFTISTSSTTPLSIALDTSAATFAGTIDSGTITSTGIVKAATTFQATAGDMTFFVNNVGEAMRIQQNTGKVGIGTTSPEAKLTIKGDALTTDQPVRITNSVNDTHTGLFLNNTGSTVGEKYGMQFGGYNQYSIGGIFGVLDSVSGSTSGDITFDLGNGTSAGSLIERMRITHEGNVGIGTYRPNEKLQVGGNIHIWDREGGTNCALYVTKATTVTTTAKINSDGASYFNGGNVGIGTTAPVYKLDVNGGVQAGGKVTYTKSAGSLNTTGYAVAGITALPSGNGFSCGFTFTCFGGVGKYQRLVYGCFNSGGTWNTKKVIDEGTNDLDVVASANGSTITFTFKARSSTQSFTPRVTVEAVGTSINSTYA